jgi:hypothetical protein
MTEHGVLGVYNTMAEAKTAVHALSHTGFSRQQVSVITQNLISDTFSEDLTPHGAATGAWVGGLVSKTPVAH